MYGEDGDIALQLPTGTGMLELTITLSLPIGRLESRKTEGGGRTRGHRAVGYCFTVCNLGNPTKQGIQILG